jgi:nucleotide-binding universal stress UspA family protein
MFTSLLVGLDGSVQAQVALAQAIQIGQRFRARILLAHVFRRDPVRAGGSGPAWMEWSSETPPNEADLKRAALEMLKDGAGAVQRAGLEVETVSRTGEPVEVLRTLAEQVGVVVVGRVGIRGTENPLSSDALGPDTRELIRRCPRPVLVTGSAPTAMDRVLVAYGGGPTSEGALAYAARFAGITGSHLDVLHVGENQEEGRKALARASGALSMAPLDFELHLLEGALDVAVKEALDRFGSNALFVGAHREEQGWLVPSHTAAILRATDIPVLVHMESATPGARTSAAHRRPTY